MHLHSDFIDLILYDMTHTGIYILKTGVIKIDTRLNLCITSRNLIKSHGIYMYILYVLQSLS